MPSGPATAAVGVCPGPVPRGKCQPLQQIFQAARAHSSLHQAAAAALRLMRLTNPDLHPDLHQEQLDGFEMYCSRHSQHVNSISIQGPQELGHWQDLLLLRQLPAGCQSISLKLLQLQLSPDSSHHGVLQASTALTDLRLECCRLLDRGSGLVSALRQLPQLQQLTLAGLHHPTENPYRRGDAVALTAPMLQEVQGLTRLALTDFALPDPSALDSLSQLTALKSVHLSNIPGMQITDQVLPAAMQLTALRLSFSRRSTLGGPGPVSLPGLDTALAGQSQLQQLAVLNLPKPAADAAAATDAFLAAVGRMTQLTMLDLEHSLQAQAPTAAAYSALTASSKLQSLSLRHVKCPPGALQHLLPEGRQLPHLQELLLLHSDVAPTTVADISRIVSSCTALTKLSTNPSFQAVPSAEDLDMLLPPLLGLTRLRSLCIRGVGEAGVDALAQFPALRTLALDYDPFALDYNAADEQLLQFTKLSQLTYLGFGESGPYYGIKIAANVSEGGALHPSML